MNGISSIRPFVAPVMRPGNLGTDVGLSGPTPLSQSDLQKIASPGSAQGISTSDQVNQPFGNVLSRFVQEVDSKQASATNQVNGLMGGENIPLHQAMIAMEEASVSFQLMVEVRNKLLESYQELMRMQV